MVTPVEVKVTECDQETWDRILAEPQIATRLAEATGDTDKPALPENTKHLIFLSYEIIFHWNSLGSTPEALEIHLAMPKSSIRGCRVLPLLAMQYVFQEFPELPTLFIEPMKGKMTNLAAKAGLISVPSEVYNFYYITREMLGEML